MIYTVDVPYITRYTHWVEAENEDEAIEKVKAGEYFNSDETGVPKAVWKNIIVSEWSNHKQ
jgi:hypothetical protein